MPTCCNVMHQVMQEGDEMISGPDKGKGASFTIRYKLPRAANVVPLRKDNAPRS
jgi:5-methylcytosine-specific restriction protein A